MIFRNKDGNPPNCLVDLASYEESTEKGRLIRGLRNLGLFQIADFRNSDF